MSDPETVPANYDEIKKIKPSIDTSRKSPDRDSGISGPPS
jgi:hypothetical protein